MRQWKRSAVSAERASMSPRPGHSGTAVLRCRVSVLAALAAVLLMLAAFSGCGGRRPDAAQPVALALPFTVALPGTLAPAPRSVEETAPRSARCARSRSAWPIPPGAPHGLPPTGLARGGRVGDGRAVRLVASVAAAGGLLLGYALFRSAGLPSGASLVGQAALPVLPVVVFGTGTALVARALPLAFLLLLLAHLVRRLGHLEGARDNAGAFTYLVLAQAASPAATVEVACLAVLLAMAESAGGARRRAVRLATSWALAAAAVLAARYLHRWGWTAPWALTPAPAALLPRALSWALVATVSGALAVTLLPRQTHARLVFAAALVAAWLALAAGMAGVAAADTPGMGLFAPWPPPAWRRLRAGSGARRPPQFLEVDLELGDARQALAGAHHLDVVHELDVDPHVLAQVLRGAAPAPPRRRARRSAAP